MTTQILVVDDEPDFQVLIQRRFRQKIRDGAYAFLFAGDGVEALEVLSQHDDIDIVVSDINMPRMDGLTLLEKLDSKDTPLKTVMVSAYGDMDNIRLAMNRGAFDFVTKPIDFEDLEITLTKALDDLNVLRHANAERCKAEQERANLARHFSPNLVNRLANGDQNINSGWERRFLTFVFTDLSDFTQLVESLEPEVIAGLLNEYLDGMTRIVFEHGGTVDKVVGDAVHAMFGAPEDQRDHADRAVACAVEMNTFAVAYAARTNETGVPLGMTRIGVHSGPAIVGNFGGENYFDYTAHGDAINTAARLESANKYLGTHICVSEETVAHVANFVGRPIGTLLLKGKKIRLAAYEPISNSVAQSDATKSYLAAFDRLAEGDPRAKQSFAAHVGNYDEDALATYHLQRLLVGETGIEISLPNK